MEGGKHGGWLVALAALAACGQEVEQTDASAPDATTWDADAAGDASDAGPTPDAGWIVDWSTCDSGAGVGLWCKTDADCCSSNCFQGSCQRPPCTSDHGTCTSDAQCCSGACASGACTPLSGVCKVVGNTCAGGSECCSQACVDGVCVQPSYCVQSGDACILGSDCCTGVCQRTGAYGLCAIEQGCQVDGTLCAAADGGPPACGGTCCSRTCAPWGPLGRSICAAPSGCHPSGDGCRADSDCCDGTGTAICVAGVCSNPTGCKPNGTVCRFGAIPCNATGNCCSGSVWDAGTCQLDENAVPRCSFSRDAGSCVAASGSCATSADCCGGAPCVPAGDAGFTCYPSTCVPGSGPCSTDGDCCVGAYCDVLHRTCADAGVTCALYGQACVSQSDCCNGVPCTAGRCAYAPP
jgi:hypothetical protein